MSATHADIVTVPTDAGDMPVHRWLPPGGTGSGVLVLQEIFGVSTYIRARSADLAEAGYVVYAPELYHRIPDASVDEDDVDRGIELAGQLPWEHALTDARTALEALHAAQERTGGLALLGFCYGGGLAFNLAAQVPPDALVSYYGSALPGLLALAPEVTMPSLHHFGTADTFVPAEQIETIRQAVTAANSSAEFVTYDGAGHAFDNPSPLFHHEQASAEAWQRTLAFLAAHLG
ncbi:dienelactone hydrolase family protein [Ruania alba]|uniref:Carboxymethylenebutenolidase n=1 Tax=Ruania alba TaxID=648782 RepID=A0A1H5KWB1_9MICO|nr:dienelactone hydrolase family protein [Ruania alba]SEE69043.1 carboxymethylenebutenolidase [Ruania alba]